MSLMAANEESDPSAILNGFWVTLFVLKSISLVYPYLIYAYGNHLRCPLLRVGWLRKLPNPHSGGDR